MPRTAPNHTGADASFALVEAVSDHLRQLSPSVSVSASGLAAQLGEDVEAVRVVLDFLAANNRVRPLCHRASKARSPWSSQRFGVVLYQPRGERLR